MHHLFVFLLCGLLHDVSATLQLHDRIVGGSPAVIEEFPYQVSIQLQGKHICGGSIIGSVSVLTAAHCVHNIPTSQLTIRAGSTFHSDGVKYNVATYQKHKLYDDNTVDFDIAIIKTTIPFKFGSRMQPIGLPLQNEVIPKAMGIVTGWGYTKEDGGVVNRYLLQISVPIIDRKKCRSMYLTQGSVTMRMFCAGYIDGTRDACQGDSGGPLVINGKLTGVVSWGYGCARPNYPGVYTKVSRFSNWINNQGPL